MFSINWQKARKAIFDPEVRLKADFPWGFGAMAKQYAVATLLYIVGSVLPVALFLLAIMVFDRVNPKIVTMLIGNDPSHVNMITLVCVVVGSFVCGFGLELWYIRRCFHKAGLSLRKSMALNLDALGGSWWAAIWRALAAFALVLVLEGALSFLPLPAVKDSAVEFASGLSRAGLVVFALMASILAPVFEEFVFRGFLFNACRTSFRQGVFQRIFRSEWGADWAAIFVSALMFALAHLNLSAILPLFMLGCVLAALYRRSGTLICPMLLHAFNNATISLVLILSLYF